MLFVKQTSKSVEEVGQALEAAAARQSFGVLAVHDLNATMANKGVDFAATCRIYEVCNPHQAKQVLERNLQISTALPCRVSVYQQPGQSTEIATILPSVMLDLYKTEDLQSVAKDVEERMIKMIEEAAG